jgi:two-component system, NarL family, nitrate/nitrite response regulator NarL
MGSSARRGESDASVVRDALVVSAVKFLRESLVEILGRVAGVRVSGQAESLSDAIDIARAACPDIVLMDVAFPGGTEAAARIGAAAPEASLIALGISETEEDVLAWAEAGIAGYVPNTASIDDMISLIGEINRGGQVSPARIVGSLLRRVAATRRADAPAAAEALLTRRELEIIDLVGVGLSNKDIARRLNISLGTTKSHVHNLLGKLSLQRRADVITRLRNAPAYSRATQKPSRPNEIAAPAFVSSTHPLSILR